MNIVIRADASQNIGSGHIMRCLVLAEQLKSRGFYVQFACLPLKGNMIPFIEAKGFKVVSLTPPAEDVIPTHDADYLGWLQRSESEDANDFLNHINHASLVITDHYAIGKVWQEIVNGKLNCKLFAIDDLCRTHAADLILDQTLGRLASEYNTEARVLAGSQFALLNPRFARLRERAFDKQLSCENVSVLVSMGGIDKPNATLHTLKQLKDTVFNVTVLLGPKAPHYEDVKRFSDSCNNVTHHEFYEDMASLMLQSDLAIGAPGTTSWERACLGLPSIIVPLAANQSDISNQLIEYRAAIRVQLDDIECSLMPSLQQLLSGWYDYFQANLSICDGLGVYRVIAEIESLLANDQRTVSLRRATEEDIAQVYEWQCHPNTRKYALNPDVPTWEQHVDWMKNKLKQKEDYFYLILNASGDRVGVIRLDRKNQHDYLVSIFIHPEHYGQGIGLQALNLVGRVHPHVNIYATVLADNIASKKLFEKAGYIQLNSEAFIRPLTE
ncbi:UDP-2,4-diacetamido-2,4,6-trideoxy-beta-L-altropyranose hydrolase [Vibrio metoecus]|uniref:UDP-2,4-diacetamido-2,4, 6-trideoxy-beta-L-altropyranose hydrolase n=1 Tax=Vibrio metoecus TaxID=1481663 RepID=UPI000BA925DF|nr:UDP-2,4-diacetamido-2,4,6-trideoxy-beta-L-altropyranose hydrolase [Vibrio metoecus]PAR27113.1 UDP-2,4-diacetamido-2,4,6-trideoxy-beta-L-altropyranose hydrolase [Vibrio metoecus]PAR60962.1 UDP-2,4-diacetamido-2,4,6-trideoxy-beta-L-altropyranose hydrolase [Vibrio metoecus]